MNRARWTVVGLFGAGLLFVLTHTIRGVISAYTPAESYVSSLPRAPGSPLPLLFRAPRLDLPEARGERVTSSTLAGHIWVANFIFTQCTSVCPTMTARLGQLERRIADGNVRFVSISVDPEHDRPETLRAYASRWRPEPRWLLLSPTPAELADVSRGFRVAVAPSGDPKSPIAHSRLLTLVDGEGWVRAIYDSDDELAWRRIADDTEELLHTHDPTPSSSVTADVGSPLARWGCNGCHDRTELAPKLAGGDDRKVMLTSGETQKVDDAYLRESIVEPNRKLVAGYAPSMPSYASSLSKAEIEELVAAIHSLASENPSAAMPSQGGPAEDPVCHMKVATVDPSLTLNTAEGQVHFCSHHCLEAFVAKQR